MSESDPERATAPPPESGTDPAPSPRLVVPVRFCRDCGGARDPSLAECPHCLQRRLAAAQRDWRSTDASSITSALALYFCLLGVSIVSILWVVGNRADRLPVEGEMAASVVFSIIVLIWCLIRQGDVLAGLVRVPHPLWLAAAAAVAVPTFLAATVVVTVLQAAGLKNLVYSTPFLEAGYGYGWVVLTICVQPAIFEELAFRGVIQSSLGAVLGRFEGAVATALLFAILHLSMPSLPHLLLLGAVLGWLRIRTDSLYPCMVTHFTHNFLVVLAERHGGFPSW